MEAKFEELIEGFITGKIGISENFLSIPLAAALHQNLLRLKRDSRMIRANIGNAVIKDKNQKTRGDKTCWLDVHSKNAAEMEFLDIIRQFQEQLNRTCYTGINSCEFHYALYEPGTTYSRHKDQLRNDYNRKFSMVSYLNEDWLDTDGGQLVIHHDEENTQEIMPTNQKALFFQSDVLEHEVVAATRPRLSITGWLKRV
jgi:SM-20-related protein